MSGMFDIGDDTTRLRSEIRALSEDLKQCQADKDFVWTLWKKLQVANPDITQAISLVIQREKEKNEVKDRKVLEVLQIKDDRIEELQQVITQKTRELTELAIRINVNEDLNRFQNEVDRLREKNANLELQLRSFENRERTLDDVRRNTIENSERDRLDLEHTLKELKQKLDNERAGRADSEANRLTLENQVMLLERDVTDKVRKFEGMIGELDEAKKLLQQYESQTNQMHRDVSYKNQELENVRKELAELWSSHNQLTEHSSQQADLIRQLQSLQQDTQKMLKSQEDAYSMEATSIQDMYNELSVRYEKVKRTEADLRAQLHSIRKELLDKDDIVATLQSKVDSFSKLYARGASALDGSFISEKLINREEPFVDYEYKIKRLDREVSLLRDKLQEKERCIDRLEKKRDQSIIEFDVSHLNHHERTHSTPARGLKDYRSIATSPMKDTTGHSRSRSMSPVRHPKGSKYQIIQAERRVEDYKNMLKLKNRELEELKAAHNKRLERLKSVQADYKILKDQVRALEAAEKYGSKSKQKKKRADPKDLRNEDSKGVWNELAYFKNENRNLVVERMALEEDIDTMKVRASQDAASIHELRVALEQERDERRHDKRKIDQRLQDRTDSQSEVTLLKSENQSKTVTINSLERELRDVRDSRDQLQGDKRMLKSELLELKQEAAEHRMEVADMKREISRLERGVDEEKRAKEKLERDNLDLCQKLEAGQKYVMSKPGLRYKTKDVKSRSQVAKQEFVNPKKQRNSQYQKALNRSIDKMKRVFRNFEDEGWEEISEDVEDEETESDTLGQHIVNMSRSVNEDSGGYKGKRYSRPVHRINRISVRNQRKGNGKLSSVPYASSSNSTTGRTVVLRETGTSPMASPVRGIKATPSPRGSDSKHNNNQVLRQLKQYKQRVTHLQQQVTALREAKSAAKKSLDDNKDTSTQLQSDLSQANKRLQMAKQTIQKLTTDVEKLQQEKGQLEVLLASKEATGDKHSEQDWKLLETRLKASSNEICRQSAQMRQMKQDNDMLQEQNRNLQDRVNRLERDTNQKRTLLEEQRSKLKQVQSSAKTDANAVEELETKIKLQQETMDKNKSQVESLKKRLSAVTREKRDYEERFLKVTNELDKKTKQLMDTQNKKMELESAVGELENTAQQQLKGLATQSEMAIEAAQDKLTNAYRQIQNYQQFIKSLGHEMVKKTSQTRSDVREVLNKRERDISREAKVNSSLQKAQSLAKNILNLSQSDIDEIMSADGDPERMAMDDSIDDKRRDKRWIKKCEKLVVSKDDFVLPLVDLFVQKIEERVELLCQMYS